MLIKIITKIITQSIDYKILSEMENQYNSLNRKLDKLQKEKKTKKKQTTITNVHNSTPGRST